MQNALWNQGDDQMNEMASKLNKNNNNLFFLQMSMFCIKTYPEQQRKKDLQGQNLSKCQHTHHGSWPTGLLIIWSTRLFWWRFFKLVCIATVSWTALTDLGHWQCLQHDCEMITTNKKGSQMVKRFKHFKTKSDYNTILHIWNYKTVDKHCLPHEK